MKKKKILNWFREYGWIPQWLGTLTLLGVLVSTIPLCNEIKMQRQVQQARAKQEHGCAIIYLENDSLAKYTAEEIERACKFLPDLDSHITDYVIFSESELWFDPLRLDTPYVHIYFLRPTDEITAKLIYRWLKELTFGDAVPDNLRFHYEYTAFEELGTSFSDITGTKQSSPGSYFDDYKIVILVPPFR